MQFLSYKERVMKINISKMCCLYSGMVCSNFLFSLSNFVKIEKNFIFFRDSFIIFALQVFVLLGIYSFLKTKKKWALFFSLSLWILHLTLSGTKVIIDSLYANLIIIIPMILMAISIIYLALRSKELIS